MAVRRCPRHETYRVEGSIRAAGILRARVRVLIATVATTAAANSRICSVIGFAVEESRQREGDEGLQQLHLRNPRNAAHRQAGIPCKESDPLRKQRDVKQREPWF